MNPNDAQRGVQLLNFEDLLSNAQVKLGVPLPIVLMRAQAFGLQLQETVHFGANNRFVVQQVRRFLLLSQKNGVTLFFEEHLPRCVLVFLR